MHRNWVHTCGWWSPVPLIFNTSCTVVCKTPQFQLSLSYNDLIEFYDQEEHFHVFIYYASWQSSEKFTEALTCDEDDLSKNVLK